MASTTSKAINVVELTYKISNGFQVAGKKWFNHNNNVNNNKKKIIALHGWLDNSSSFDKIAPYIVEHTDFDIYALDLPGHGFTDHLDGMAYYFHQTHVLTVGSILDEIKRNENDDSKVVILGHSMGAGIAITTCATFPDMTNGLILIDGVGQVSEPESNVCNHLRTAYDLDKKNKLKKKKVNSTNNNNTNKYNNIETMIKKRQKAVTQFPPGNQQISFEAAYTILNRGIIDLNEENGNDHSNANNKQLAFNHDLRLISPAPFRQNEDQIRNAFENIDCPVTVVLAENGWPMGKNGGPLSVTQAMDKDNIVEVKHGEYDDNNMAPLINPRLNILYENNKLDPELDLNVIPNSYHHLHLEEDTYRECGEYITRFLNYKI